MPTDQREQAEEQRHTNGGEQPAVKEKETQQDAESAEEASGQRYAETSDGETEEHQHETGPQRAGISDDQAEERLHAATAIEDPQRDEDFDEQAGGNDAGTPNMPDAEVNRAGISDETFGEQDENLWERHEQEVVEVAAGQQEENPTGPEAAATAVQTRTERRKEKGSSKQRQGEQEEAAAEAQTQTKPLEETAPDEQKRKQQQETGDAADKVTRKQQKKEQKKNKRKKSAAIKTAPPHFPNMVAHYRRTRTVRRRTRFRTNDRLRRRWKRQPHRRTRMGNMATHHRYRDKQG